MWLSDAVMQMYHLGLILAALVATLALILWNLGKAIVVRADAAQRLLPSFLPVKAEERPAHDQAEIVAEVPPRIRRRTLARLSEDGADSSVVSRLLESDISTQVVKNLERAFDSYATGRTTIARYRASVESEEQAVLRYLANARIESTKLSDLQGVEEASQALEAIRWCLRWAEEMERSGRTERGPSSSQAVTPASASPSEALI